MAAAPDTSQRILDIAERLVQTRGFNGFSYADIAGTLHVTKASLHYHFPAKADLGRRLIERYERHFFDENERWLTTVLQQGKREKVLKFSGTSVEAARALVGSLEGAMMIAR